MFVQINLFQHVFYIKPYVQILCYLLTYLLTNSENPKRTQVIVSSMNMGYDIYLTQPGLGTRNLFRTNSFL